MKENKTFEQELVEILPNAIKQAKVNTKNGNYIWRGAIGTGKNNDNKITITLENNKVRKIVIENRICQQ